jgi:hypothetical protein
MAAERAGVTAAGLNLESFINLPETKPNAVQLEAGVFTESIELGRFHAFTGYEGP